MKTKLVISLAAAITASFLFNNLSFGQNEKNIPTVDNHTLTMAFHKTDTILVVVPAAYKLTDADKNDIESYVFWVNGEARPAYAYKTEAEVNAEDSKKHILLYGSFDGFERKEFLKIPIRKEARGFRFKNRIYDQDVDGFFYINKNATRMYVCKNSAQIRHELFSIGVSAYPLHIFHGHEIVVTGVIF